MKNLYLFFFLFVCLFLFMGFLGVGFFGRIFFNNKSTLTYACARTHTKSHNINVTCIAIGNTGNIHVLQTLLNVRCISSSCAVRRFPVDCHL